jgi:sulfur-carrier protein
MGITIALPSALLPYAGGSGTVVLHDRCDTVGDVLAALGQRYAGVTDRVMDERGQVRRHVNVFVDGEDVRHLGGLAAPVAESSTVVIFPAVSGG